MATLGLHTVGDLLEHLPRDRREARTVAAAARGRAGHRGRAGALDRLRAGASPRYARTGRGECVRRDAARCARRSSTSPGWWTAIRAGTRLVLHGKADGRGRFRVSHHAPGSSELRGRRRAGRGRSPIIPRREGVTSTQILTLVREAGVRSARCARAAARPACESPSGCPTRDAALAAMHFPATPRMLAARDAAPGLRGAAADPAGLPAPPRRSARRRRRARACASRRR